MNQFEAIEYNKNIFDSSFVLVFPIVYKQVFVKPAAL